MRILLNGAAGHMGRIVRRLIEEAPARYTLAAAVDGAGGQDFLPSLEDFAGEAHCIVDFSHHSATQALLAFAVRRRMALVIATTGQTEAERACIHEAGRSIPIFFASNMSPAVALLADMAMQAARLFPDADIEIVESHHNRKVDVPSGTALFLADALQRVRENSALVVGRHQNGRRMKGEIGIHSLRLGNEVGTHEIHIATATQTITLRHEAHDRALFAEGALAVADFLVGRLPGVYAMQDMLNAQA